MNMSKLLVAIVLAYISAISVSENNPCLEQPCLNGGSCFRVAEMRSGFICRCTPCFQGASCEWDQLCDTEDVKEQMAELETDLLDQQHSMKIGETLSITFIIIAVFLICMLVIGLLLTVIQKQRNHSESKQKDRNADTEKPELDKRAVVSVAASKCPTEETPRFNYFPQAQKRSSKLKRPHSSESSTNNGCSNIPYAPSGTNLSGAASKESCCASKTALTPSCGKTKSICKDQGNRFTVSPVSNDKVLLYGRNFASESARNELIVPMCATSEVDIAQRNHKSLEPTSSPASKKDTNLQLMRILNENDEGATKATEKTSSVVTISANDETPSLMSTELSSDSVQSSQDKERSKNELSPEITEESLADDEKNVEQAPREVGSSQSHSIEDIGFSSTVSSPVSDKSIKEPFPQSQILPLAADTQASSKSKLSSTAAERAPSHTSTSLNQIVKSKNLVSAQKPSTGVSSTNQSENSLKLFTASPSSSAISTKKTRKRRTKSKAAKKYAKNK